jgi:serine/threonine-protein kinase RsbT
VAALTIAPPVRLTVTVRADADHARREARARALAIGFDRADAERVALAVGELATNLVRYGLGGQITLSTVEGPDRVGVEVECEDRGPGIPDVDRALEDGFSTGGGLGSGLPAARRLLDDLAIETGPGGTRIVGRKWAKGA